MPMSILYYYGYGRPQTFNIQLAAVTDTPVKSKSTLTAPAILDGLEHGRQAVMRDLGYSIPLVPLAYFQSALLPPLR